MGEQTQPDYGPLMTLRLKLTAAEKRIEQLEGALREAIDLACHYSELGEDEVRGLIGAAALQPTGDSK